MRYSLMLFSLLLFACGGGTSNNQSDEEQKLLSEAAQIHEEAIKVEKNLLPRLQELRQRANQIQVVGRELTPEEMNFVNAVSALELRHQQWSENHVEVPGHEHHDHDHHGHDHHGHDHNHDHDHDHGPALELTAADMLLVQKEFRDSILAIQTSLTQLEKQ